MPSVIIFPLSANSDTLTLLFAHISFQHRAILRSPALPLDHFPIGLQHHFWHCKGLNLLARIIRYRGKAKINRALHRYQVANTPPVQCTNSLPHDIVEMIIGHPIHDVRTLKVCSLTCYSWYIAAFPYYPSYPRPRRSQRGSVSALKSTCAGFVAIHKGNPNTTRNFWQIDLVFIPILPSSGLASLPRLNERTQTYSSVLGYHLTHCGT